MKKNLWLLLVLFLLASASLLAVSVHDIQYTTVTGTYPSPLAGQSVTVTNVVVIAKEYSGGSGSTTGHGWYVSDLGGGPWSGLYVYDNTYYTSILVGDIVNVTGLVSEYNGLTELGPVTTVEVISRGNPIPGPIDITTLMLTQAANIEPYEGVLVQVKNVRVTATPTATYYEWKVTDGSGSGQIDDGFSSVVTFSGLSTPIFMNETWYKIRGVVDYGHNEYAINPRSYSDMIRFSQISISENLSATSNSIVDIPIVTSLLRSDYNFKKFSFALEYDPQRLEILKDSFTFENTILSENGIADSLHITYSVLSADTIYVSYETTNVLTCAADDTLLILRARTKLFGSSPLKLYNFKYNTTAIEDLSAGKVSIMIPKKQAFMNIYNPSFSYNPKYSLNHFNPKMEKIRIDFGGKTNESTTASKMKGILRIYDSQGRLVITLFNEVINSGSGVTSVDWDGRNSEMNMVPIGLYYCHVELIDRANGDKQSTVQPIVVGTPLK